MASLYHRERGICRTTADTCKTGIVLVYAQVGGVGSGQCNRQQDPFVVWNGESLIMVTGEIVLLVGEEKLELGCPGFSYSAVSMPYVGITAPRSPPPQWLRYSLFSP